MPQDLSHAAMHEERLPPCQCPRVILWAEHLTEGYDCPAIMYKTTCSEPTRELDVWGVDHRLQAHDVGRLEVQHSLHLAQAQSTLHPAYASTRD